MRLKQKENWPRELGSTRWHLHQALVEEESPMLSTGLVSISWLHFSPASDLFLHCSQRICLLQFQVNSSGLSNSSPEIPLSWYHWSKPLDHMTTSEQNTKGRWVSWVHSWSQGGSCPSDITQTGSEERVVPCGKIRALFVEGEKERRERGPSTCPLPS